MSRGNRAKLKGEKLNHKGNLCAAWTGQTKWCPINHAAEHPSNGPMYLQSTLFFPTDGSTQRFNVLKKCIKDWNKHGKNHVLEGLVPDNSESDRPSMEIRRDWWSGLNR
jgi:hypothetical protein